MRRNKAVLRAHPRERLIFIEFYSARSRIFVPMPTIANLSRTDGQKLSGEVLGCEGGVLRLRTDGGEISVRLDEIKKARTYVQW